jgi:putative phosphonate metabolism protein
LSDATAPPAPLPRYALYYAPRPEDGLAATASQWLGRNPETGQTRAVRPVQGLAPERLSEILAEPGLYGFHGTLKAPIALADECSERDLLDAVGRFAARERAFLVPSLELAELSGFLALVPATRCADLQDLADRCVVEFDEFRRPAEESELARRRASGLTPRQDALLVRWGYPYVLDEWRFHLTLTGRIACKQERETVAAALQQRFAGVVDRPLPVSDLCIFRQPAPGRPFTVLARFRLGGGRRVRTETWQAP